MNKLKKISLTALAGSLVAVSATAGEMSVSGSLGATYSTQNGTTQVLQSMQEKDFQWEINLHFLVQVN